MSDKYDVAIIGGGHNGLITAAYLAKAGRKVLVLEKKKIIGGIAVTEEFFPGFKASSITDESDSLSPKVVADLNLKQLGLEVLPAEILIFAPQKDDRHLIIWNDVQRTVREIAPFSRADADAYPLFIKEMGKVAQIITALNHTILPDMPHAGLKDMLEMIRLVKPIRSLGWKNITRVMRILPMSVADLLGEWFDSDIVKAAIAASALNNISLGPQESGTAYSFLQNFANSNNGLFRSGGQVKGGMGTLSQTLADAAKKFGAQILTNTEVSQISMDNGRANGVVLANGYTFPAGTVVSALDMRSTFLQLVDSSQVDETVLKNVQRITYCGTMARVHFALDTLPSFTSMTGTAQQILSGHIQIAPSIVALQKAFDPVKYGQFTERPYLDIRIPTLNDPSLAPGDKHVMSVTVKYIPYHLREGNWEVLRDPLGRLVTKTISDLAPDFDQCVQHCHVITPLDMETVYDLPEGSLVHGDTRLDQSFWMRPIPGFTQYQAPLKGLYLCGAATHPGAGVTGINGLNAARKILKGKR
ncbi:NAD(P)/FAD-dependent oxidoreductase [Desulfobacterales bacterium]|nr:NAD(P)/FAD-dependent oxidoreductase [Desulfobacterales bacterium]